MNHILSEALEQNNYHFPAEIQAQFISYLQLLQKWNRVFNLTAIDSIQEMIYSHLLDSLSIQPYLHGNTMLDVGSGAGLPGIPLAIANRHIKWTLIDKSQKKTRFLTQVVAELGLKNIAVVCSRCENFHSQQCFDSIISRAFGTIKLLIETTKHLICPQGHFLAMKGTYPQDEINEIPKEFITLGVHELTIKKFNAQRHLVIVGRSAN